MSPELSRPEVYIAVLTNKTLLAAEEGEELCGNATESCKTKSRNNNEADKEEDFLFVAMDEGQSDVATSKATSASPSWRRARHSLLGLLMANVIAGISLGGCNIVGNIVSRQSPSMLAYVALSSLVYIGVYTRVWALLGKIYQAIVSSTRHEAMVFVDTVKHHTAIWNCVCMFLAVLWKVAFQGEALWIMWAFGSAALGWVLVLAAADVLGVTG